MSNKLALLVSFAAQDRLSSAIRTITRDAKEGAKAIKGLASDEARLRKELDAVNRELRETTGIHPALLNKQAELQKTLRRTSDALDDQRRQMERIRTIERRADKFGTAAMTAGAVTAATVTVPVVAGVSGSIEQAMAAQELNSAFEVTFGKQTAMMNKWAEETGNKLGRSTQEMQRFSNSFGLLFTQTAAPEKAAEMSKNFAVLAQDLSSFYDTDPQQAMERLMSGLSGESEPMRKFGVFLNEGAVKAKALAMGLGGAGRELTDQEKIMARYQLILEGTTKAQGDVTRTSGSATNKLRELKGQWEEQNVAIGDKLIPLIPPLADALMTVLTAFNNLSPGTQKFIVYAALAGAALGPLLMGLGGLAFAVKNIAGPIGGAITLFRRLRAIGGLVGIFAKLKAGVSAFRMVFSGLTMVMRANPFIFFATLIAGAALLIWANWDKIKGAFNGAISYLSGAWAWLKANARTILEFSGPIGQAALFIWDNWATIKKAFGDALAWIGGKISSFISVGRQIIDGLVSGITAAPGKIWAALKRIISGAWTSAKEFLGIASPSRLFMQMGGHISQGMALGIDRGGRQPLGSMKRLAAGVAAAGAMTLGTASAAGAHPGNDRRGPPPAAGAASYNFEFKIYASDGQSAKEIAKEVMREIEKATGISGRSTFDDGD